jgi:hypothetical protein
VRFWQFLITIVRPIYAAAIIFAADAGNAQTWSLVSTIDMTGYDILNIASDQSHLFILNNNVSNGPDAIKVVDLQGNFLRSFDTPSAFSIGITYDGTKIVFGSGPDADHTYLRTMDALTGATSVPLSSNLRHLNGLGCDSTNLLASYAASGSWGVLTSAIDVLDSSTYNLIRTLSVTYDTGTTIGWTPSYGVARHDGDLFLAISGVNEIYRFDHDLILSERIPVLSHWSNGLTFVGNDLFVAERGAHKIYRYSPLPEPSTLALTNLAVVGLLGLALYRRHRAPRQT